MVKVKENDRQRHVVFLVSYRLRNTACTAKDTIAVATVTAAVIFAVVISSSFVGFAFAAMSNVLLPLEPILHYVRILYSYLLLQYRLFLLG